jgi:hypothetical protein
VEWSPVGAEFQRDMELALIHIKREPGLKGTWRFLILSSFDRRGRRWNRGDILSRLKWGRFAKAQAVPAEHHHARKNEGDHDQNGEWTHPSARRNDLPLDHDLAGFDL